jgi:sugar O-acyltransferase (sialic acid O-acetyltransferase NeuD family)
VLGPVADAVRMVDVAVTVCTGSPADFSSRRRIVEALGLDHDRYATLVHPAAGVPTTLSIGRGCVLQAGVVATTDVSIGDHVLVMPNVVFTHDDVIGDYVTIGAGVGFAGGVRVGDGAYVGAGALVREGRTIGAGALVGMGSVVLDDVPPGEVWCGNPARRLRDVAPSGAREQAMNGRGRNPQ